MTFRGSPAIHLGGQLVPFFALSAWWVDLAWQLSTPGAIGSPLHWVPALAIGVLGLVAWSSARHPFVRRAAMAGTVAAAGALPLDLWWHTTRPYDVDIVTVPHGILAVSLGALLTVLAFAPRDQPPDRLRRAPRAWLLGLLLTWITTIATDLVGRPNLWQGTESYLAAAAVFPFLLVAATDQGRQRWSALAAAGAYLAVVVLLRALLEVLPTPPQSGVVANPETRAVAPAFPLLLVVPAVAVDLVVARVERTAWRRHLVAAVVIGAIFVALLFASQWVAADFVLEVAARRGWVGMDRWPYHTIRGGWRFEQWALDPRRRAMAAGLAIAAVAASVSALAGLRAGRVGAPGRGA